MFIPKPRPLKSLLHFAALDASNTIGVQSELQFLVPMFLFSGKEDVISVAIAASPFLIVVMGEVECSVALFRNVGLDSSFRDASLDMPAKVNVTLRFKHRKAWPSSISGMLNEIRIFGNVRHV